jgi:3-phenylpropionate/trans-cinnamate dioxygenase ferredoxin subunit
VPDWTRACGTDEVEPEDVIDVVCRERHYAVYRSAGDEYYATDGLCTHQQVLLADGLVIGYIIECPKHNGRFDYRTGHGQGAPITEHLRTYPVKLEASTVFVDLA